MDTQTIVNALIFHAPGTEWKSEGETSSGRYHVHVFSTSAQALELPGEFMLGLYSEGIRIHKIRVKRSGLIARLTLELIIP